MSFPRTHAGTRPAMEGGITKSRTPHSPGRSFKTYTKADSTTQCLEKLKNLLPNARLQKQTSEVGRERSKLVRYLYCLLVCSYVNGLIFSSPAACSRERDHRLHHLPREYSERFCGQGAFTCERVCVCQVWSAAYPSLSRVNVLCRGPERVWLVAMTALTQVNTSSAAARCSQPGNVASGNTWGRGQVGGRAREYNHNCTRLHQYSFSGIYTPIFISPFLCRRERWHQQLQCWRTCLSRQLAWLAGRREMSYRLLICSSVWGGQSQCGPQTQSLLC